MINPMKLFMIGVGITTVSWYLSWHHGLVLSEYAFIPLWIGYILTTNGISELAIGDSLLRHMGYRRFLLLFIISIPLWWFFELLNSIIHNWQYILPHVIGPLEYTIRASISFSTVVPAVLSTSYLVVIWLKKKNVLIRRTHLQNFRKTYLFISITVGATLIGSLVLWPAITFPLVWIAPLLIFDPLAYLLGAPSLLSSLQRGYILLPVGVATATLGTGFFWEFWNFYSLPKWIYNLPYLNSWHIFEMPLFGYLGYLPFGLCVFSYTALSLDILSKLKLRSLTRSLEWNNSSQI